MHTSWNLYRIQILNARHILSHLISLILMFASPLLVTYINSPTIKSASGVLPSSLYTRSHLFIDKVHRKRSCIFLRSQYSGVISVSIKHSTSLNGRRSVCTPSALNGRTRQTHADTLRCGFTHINSGNWIEWA